MATTSLRQSYGFGLLLLVMAAGVLAWLSFENRSRSGSEGIDALGVARQTAEGLAAPLVPLPTARQIEKKEGNAAKTPIIGSREQLEEVQPGDRVKFARENNDPPNSQDNSESQSRRFYTVTIHSKETLSGATLIKGRVDGGRQFIATIGPASVNVFLQGASEVLRFSDSNFTGQLAVLQRSNLEQDIRIRPIAKGTRLEE